VCVITSAASANAVVAQGTQAFVDNCDLSV
jgi:hypothetical protein